MGKEAESSGKKGWERAREGYRLEAGKSHEALQWANPSCCKGEERNNKWAPKDSVLGPQEWHLAPHTVLTGLCIPDESKMWRLWQQWLNSALLLLWFVYFSHNSHNILIPCGQTPWFIPLAVLLPQPHISNNNTTLPIGANIYTWYFIPKTVLNWLPALFTGIFTITEFESLFLPSYTCGNSHWQMLTCIDSTHFYKLVEKRFEETSSPHTHCVLSTASLVPCTLTPSAFPGSDSYTSSFLPCFTLSSLPVGPLRPANTHP